MRGVRLVGGATVAVAALLLADPWSAAESATPSCVPQAGTSARFCYTGHEQKYVVPAGVTSIKVVAVGGHGGSGGRGGSGGGTGGAGGVGAVATAVLPVTPGRVLYVEVGADNGGFGGGGRGQLLVRDDVAGSGGGASDIRTVTELQGTVSEHSRVLVAAGGGGGGAGGILGGPTEKAGGAGGDGGVGQLGSGSGGTDSGDGSAHGGAPGTTEGPGPGGPGAPGVQGPVNGEDGGTGPGGDGGLAAGGGGGGGYYGGGGGGGSSPGSLRAGGGGGAGASFITPLGVDTSFTSDKTGIPMVTISPAQLLLGANGGAEITAASLMPNPFCTKLTRNCPHPGAQLAFKLAKPARLDVVVTDRHEGKVLRRRTLDGVAGANSFAIGGKGLKQGRYLMILTALRDGAASKPVRIRFRISSGLTPRRMHR